MRLKTGYAFNCKDLFENFNIKYIKTSPNILKKFYKTKEKKEMAVKVFLYAIRLILQDIIENNITFALPSRRRSQIQMGSISGDSFKEARKNGKFKDVDFMESNFTGYHLEYVYWTKHSEKRKQIYVDKELKSKITEQSNNGKRYF